MHLRKAKWMKLKHSDISDDRENKIKDRSSSFICAVCGISGFLFGYDLCVMVMARSLIREVSVFMQSNWLYIKIGRI